MSGLIAIIFKKKVFFKAMPSQSDCLGYSFKLTTNKTSEK